jgi:hypothetical protein
MMRPLRLIFAALAAVAPLRAAVFESGDAQTLLVELYTSEGCSSCPPAEERLAQFRDDPALWRDVVPIAFHVDYWDNLGWPDRFATPEFTQRQRDYGARWRAETIYTPAFVLNGHEGRSTTPTGRPGRLRAEVEDSGTVTVTFQPTQPPVGALVAEVAPLAGGIVSDVRRGENAGRRLAHEFVALALLSAPLEAQGGRFTAKCTLPRKTVAPASALAVWVHPAGDPTPLQAAGGWLKK